MDGVDLDDYPIITEGTKVGLTIKSNSPSQEHQSQIQIVGADQKFRQLGDQLTGFDHFINRNKN
ncbi:hypothetical protein RJ639_016844 [Escallonia herrerae]|uniref:Uncharacterized protein n=1 Tax=Escallonia herrerae TaxID=1293975 RepID=A0AA88VEK4_9ASTE|nr:hypothetical protein RJ639_016844 [Escallonia herrerae]